MLVEKNGLKPLNKKIESLVICDDELWLKIRKLGGLNKGKKSAGIKIHYHVNYPNEHNTFMTKVLCHLN